MSSLPPKPDFAAIEAAAPKGGGRRMVTLTLIGNLVHCWSNNESLFIYILMLLMETDEARRRSCLPPSTQRVRVST